MIGQYCVIRVNCVICFNVLYMPRVISWSIFGMNKQLLFFFLKLCLLLPSLIILPSQIPSLYSSFSKFLPKHNWDITIGIRSDGYCARSFDSMPQF